LILLVERLGLEPGTEVLQGVQADRKQLIYITVNWFIKAQKGLS
jgi:hypothetical protein